VIAQALMPEFFVVFLSISCQVIIANAAFLPHVIPHLATKEHENEWCGWCDW
jgi:hypothetical protein